MINKLHMIADGIVLFIGQPLLVTWLAGVGESTGMSFVETAGLVLVAYIPVMLALAILDWAFTPRITIDWRAM